MSAQPRRLRAPWTALAVAAVAAAGMVALSIAYWTTLNNPETSGLTWGQARILMALATAGLAAAVITSLQFGIHRMMLDKRRIDLLKHLDSLGLHVDNLGAYQSVETGRNWSVFHVVDTGWLVAFEYQVRGWGMRGSVGQPQFDLYLLPLAPGSLDWVRVTTVTASPLDWDSPVFTLLDPYVQTDMLHPGGAAPQVAGVLTGRGLLAPGARGVQRVRIASALAGVVVLAAGLVFPSALMLFPFSGRAPLNAALAGTNEARTGDTLGVPVAWKYVDGVKYDDCDVTVEFTPPGAVQAQRKTFSLGRAFDGPINNKCEFNTGFLINSDGTECEQPYPYEGCVEATSREQIRYVISYPAGDPNLWTANPGGLNAGDWTGGVWLTWALVALYTALLCPGGVFLIAVYPRRQNGP